MDVDTIKSLVEMMSEHALTEVIIRDGDSRVVLRRGAMGNNEPAPASTPPARVTAAEPLNAPAATAAVTEIKAPMVGTFYAAPDPEAAPFVEVGSTVEPDTVVCIIEAMKVFNEIKAETSGTIERVLEENGGPVEFGQPLFVVRHPS